MNQDYLERLLRTDHSLTQHKIVQLAQQTDTSDLLVAACKLGRVDVVRVLYEVLCVHLSSTHVNLCVAHQQLECLKYLFAHNAPYSPNLIEYCVDTTKTLNPTLKYLVANKHQLGLQTHSTVTYKCRKNTELLMFLIDNGCEYNIFQLVDVVNFHDFRWKRLTERTSSSAHSSKYKLETKWLMLKWKIYQSQIKKQKEYCYKLHSPYVIKDIIRACLEPFL
jgi:hypothetical protein